MCSDETVKRAPRWTAEQLDAVWNEVALGEVCHSSALCAALLDARAERDGARAELSWTEAANNGWRVQAEKKNALIATLKAECRAWRAWWTAWHSRDDGVLPIAEADALGVARAATDALVNLSEGHPAAGGVE